MLDKPSFVGHSNNRLISAHIIDGAEIAKLFLHMTVLQILEKREILQGYLNYFNHPNTIQILP